MSSNEKTEKQITEALIDGRRADLLRIEHGRVRDLRDVIAGGAHMAGTAVQNALLIQAGIWLNDHSRETSAGVAVGLSHLIWEGVSPRHEAFDRLGRGVPTENDFVVPGGLPIAIGIGDFGHIGLAGLKSRLGQLFHEACFTQVADAVHQRALWSFSIAEAIIASRVSQLALSASFGLVA